MVDLNYYIDVQLFMNLVIVDSNSLTFPSNWSIGFAIQLPIGGEISQKL